MNPNDEYLDTRVMTATPYQLHQMVVEGAVRFARQAREAMVQGDRETAFHALSKARELVGEILGGLDQRGDLQLVEQLKLLFFFVYRNLSLADLQHDPGRVEAALKVLEIHRQTWIELGAQLAEAGTAPIPGADPPSEHSWSG